MAAIRAGIPGVDVQRAGAEQLPFAEDEFDCAAAQLVVHFMSDPVAGLTEMARVTRGGGLVAACMGPRRRHRPGFAVLARSAGSRPECAW